MKTSTPLMAALLMTAAAFACVPSNETTDAGIRPDAGAHQTSDDAGTPPGVRFTATIQLVEESGKVTAGQTTTWLESSPPAALVPGGLPDGGYRQYLAEAPGAEGYAIPGVPEGHYHLRFNDIYLWTDAREVQLLRTVVQRPSLVWDVPAGTALQLRVSGLTPWQGSDVLRLSAPNGGSPIADRRLSTASDFGGSLPAPGAEQIELTVPWTFTQLDGAQGDSLWVQQLSENSGLDGGYPFTSVVRSFQQPTFQLSLGETTVLDAPLAGGTERTVAFEVDGSGFATQLQAAHPDAGGLHAINWAIGARPGAEPFALLGSKPELAFASMSVDVPLAPFTVRFLDAFPESWRRVGHVSASTLVPLTWGGATFTATLSQWRSDTLEAMVGDHTLAPRLGPVRNLRISGQDASAGLEGVGRSPVVSWDPPLLGTPSRYFVHMIPLTMSGTRFVGGALPTFVVTSETEVPLPPEVTPGSYFVVKVTATRGAGPFSPYEGELPLDLAEATTGILQP